MREVRSSPRPRSVDGSRLGRLLDCQKCYKVTDRIKSQRPRQTPRSPSQLGQLWPDQAGTGAQSDGSRVRSRPHQQRPDNRQIFDRPLRRSQGRLSRIAPDRKSPGEKSARYRLETVALRSILPDQVDLPVQTGSGTPTLPPQTPGRDRIGPRLLNRSPQHPKERDDASHPSQSGPGDRQGGDLKGRGPAQTGSSRQKRRPDHTEREPLTKRQQVPESGIDQD